MTVVVGVDLSLTATGIADADGLSYVSKTRLTGMARLAYLRNWVTGFAYRGVLVVVEDYAYHSGDAHAHALGELGGVVRLALHERNIPYVDVVPSQLKKFATNKGNASKDQMLAAAVRAGFDGDNNNAADAFWLREMGLYRHADPAGIIAWTQYREDVVAKIVWPDLQSVA